MSATRLTTRSNVRQMLGDITEGAYAISNERLDVLIENWMQEIGGMLNLGTKTLSLAITSNATGDYALPAGGVEYAQIFGVTRGSDGIPVTKRAPGELKEAWVDNPAATGSPSEYAVRETDGQVLTIRTRPITVDADTLEIFYSQLPDALSTDASTIPFGRLALAALQHYVAASAVSGMSKAMREQLGLEGSFIAEEKANGQRAVLAERERIATLKRQPRMAHAPW